MSRSDLDRIQARLKVAIQNHQLLVAKMKADPQNSGLQQQLHELQSQITSLSERQKTIVQLLKKELVVKPSQASQSPTVTTSAQVPMPAHIKVMPQTAAAVNITPEPTRQLPVLAPKPVNNVHQLTVHSPPMSSAQTQGTDATAMDSQDGGLLNNNSKTVLSENVPEVSQKSNVAPLKVPQYHSSRPSILQNSSQQVPGSITTCPLVPVTTRTVPDPELTSFKKFAVHKEATPEERKKLEFMASLELITPEAVKEFQNRRSERKRRSTANPQYSYSNYEPEAVRLRTLPHLSHVQLSSSLSKNDVSESCCAVCRHSGELLVCDTCNLSYHARCVHPPVTSQPQGSWSCPKCQSLNKQIATNWPKTLELVHSYIAHKAAKEEEKRKLSKHVKELQIEKKQLELKAKKLTETIAQQVQKKAELMNAYRTAQQSVDKLKNLIRVFQTS